MKKYGGTRYNSLWDGSTWFIIALVVAVCIWPIFIDDWVLPVVLTAIMLAIVIVLFKSIYYKIDGNNLVIYQFFVPSAFPIDKIESVLPTKSILSSPSTSITHRIAIKFSDRKVLKSSMPLIISPVRQQEFIDQLVSINPNIKH